MRGLASIIALITLLAITYVALRVGDIELVIAGIILIGSISGYYILNISIRPVYLGNSGAYLLGFNISLLTILLVTRNPSVSPWFAILVNGYPILESIYSFWRRKFISKISNVLLDDGHFHHIIYDRLLLWMGISQDKSSKFNYEFHSGGVKVSSYIIMFSVVAAIPSLLLWKNSRYLQIYLLSIPIIYSILYIALSRKKYKNKIYTDFQLPPILITTCIRSSDETVKLKDENLRLKHTLEGIENWARIHPQGNYVICDGSNYDISKMLQERCPNLNIEFLKFQNSIEDVRKKGKGFGEGEIINYALEHSHFLKNAKYFFKCTGKLWVENFHEIVPPLSTKFGSKAVFKNILGIIPLRLIYIDTRFFFVSKDFYQKELGTLYSKTNFLPNHSIEDLYLDRFQKLSLESHILSTTPIIFGMSGGSASFYKNNLFKNIKNFIHSSYLKNSFKFRKLICFD